MISLQFAALLAAAICALCLTPLVIRLASAKALLDAPGHRRVHTVPVPRIGGIAVYIAFVMGLATAMSLGALETSTTWSLLLGSGLLFFAGLVDDVRGIPPAAKVMVQCLAALIAWVGGVRPEALAVAYGTSLSIGILSLPFLMLWVVLVTNAYNLVDGINGLAVGVGLVATASAMLVGFMFGNAGVVTTAAVIAGGYLGFLRYNFPSARIFLGDSGSMPLGFLLAVLLVSGSTSHGAVWIVVPIFALSIPLLDTGLAVVRRWLRNVPLSDPDARHIHHRLLAIGFSHGRATVALCAVALGISAFGLLVTLAPPVVAWVTSILGMLALASLFIYGASVLSYHELEVASQVLFSGLGRARRVIRDQIAAVDINEKIAAARSFEDVEAVLAANASQFGFVRMEVWPSQSEWSGRLAQDLPDGRRTWRLDYPLLCRQDDSTTHLTLSIWCWAEEGSRPFGAERVIRILAPVLEQWITDHPSVFVTQSLDKAAGFVPRILVGDERTHRHGEFVLPLHPTPELRRRRSREVVTQTSAASGD